jgi:hypothetical protein
MLHVIPGSHWPFDLRRNTCLRSVQIKLDSGYDDTGLVMQMLSQISSARIEEVGLIISAGEDDLVDEVRWDEIDAALQHSSFSGLRSVNVRVVQRVGWNSDAVPWVMDHMPQCHARGILHVCEREWQNIHIFYPDRVFLY